jgi:putative tricarboxylic transport membrane protein
MSDQGAAAGVVETEMDPIAELRASVDESGLVDRRADLAVSMSVVVLGLGLIVGSLSIRRGAVAQDHIGVTGLPRAIGAFLIVAGCVLVVRRLRGWSAATTNLVSSEGGKADESGYPATGWRPVWFMVAALGWALLLVPLGFLISTALLGLAVLWVSDIRAPLKLLLIPPALTLSIWLLFDRIVGVILPGGPIGSFIDQLIPRL